MAKLTTIKLYSGTGTPPNGSLEIGEAAFDLANRTLYTSTNGTDVVIVTGDAAQTEFTPAAGVSATDVQAAIEEVALGSGGVAEDVSFNPASSTLTATDVQAAIDEEDQKVESHTGDSDIHLPPGASKQTLVNDGLGGWAATNVMQISSGSAWIGSPLHNSGLYLSSFGASGPVLAIAQNKEGTTNHSLSIASTATSVGSSAGDTNVTSDNGSVRVKPTSAVGLEVSSTGHVGINTNPAQVRFRVKGEATDTSVIQASDSSGGVLLQGYDNGDLHAPTSYANTTPGSHYLTISPTGKLSRGRSYP